ncbi:extensin-like domain-containing protein [Sphingomonas hylomeconis]|uniref:Extensin family protein n=1 Tax=Sphingomonas hylomeconis TaxID=1395958 RepID=A0ABV7SZW5_9SPHN|nr:extensin family protein [Sphingomonas hylomeconis]
MRVVRRVIGWLVALAVLAVAALALFALTRGRPQDLPWTPLDLAQPAGMFTGRKIAALGTDFPACRALLDRAGVGFTALPAVRDGQCGYDDGVRLTGGARRIAFAPANVGISCPVAAGLSVWEWNVIQPAAQRLFGQRVASIEHLGSYNCRRLYGRSQGDFSEHASANALDVAGFRLADGTRISVLKNWQDTGDKGTFLRAVRDGGCRVFATVLSPDYNAAHRDHLHLDQADRGPMGWRACR